MFDNAPRAAHGWRQSRMNKILVTSFALLAGLPGWAVPAGAELFSSTGPVIAILAGDLFLGEAEGRLGGSGTVWIQSRARPEVICRGSFSSSAELGGAGSMLCSDGVTATFRFTRLGLAHGHGTGNSSRGPLSFTYGLNPVESEPYLKAPPGKALRLGGNEVVLVDAAQPIPAALNGSRP